MDPNNSEPIPLQIPARRDERTIALINECGNPQKELKMIQVAGTNGKGSVCAILEKIYRTAGYKTGLFTSPHLNRLNERFRIN